MKCRVSYAITAVSFVGLIFASLTFLPASASAREIALPAGTLLQCTLNEPNFSSATAEVGDPVLCHLRGVTEFGQQAFPRGSYLVGHLEAAKEPGHFVGKGSLKLQFDRIGLPSGDLPLDSKVIATRGYKVDKEGKIVGHGHATRDVVEWMLPPLWPWKVIMLPARGPRPKLKGETTLELRLMDDVVIPQVASSAVPGLAPGWHYFGAPSQGQSYQGVQGAEAGDYRPAAARDAQQPRASYAMYVTPDAAQPSTISSAQIAAASPGVPVFVLKTGAVLNVGNYAYGDGRITYTLAGGGGGVIDRSEIDWSTTTRVNTARGVRLSLSGGRLTPTTGL